MAFSDYKSISHVQRDFKVKYQEETFLVVQDLQPTATFLEEFRFSMDNIDVYTSEGSRAEAIIFPILREVYKHYYQRYSFWVQKALTVDEKLNGTPDYLIGTKSALGKTFLETPLVIIAEAKKNDFEQGWGQCLAELIAAQKFNRNTRLAVYGIVTDGRVWEFGKLKEDVFTKHTALYTVDHLARLFGALHAIFQAVGASKPGRKASKKSTAFDRTSLTPAQEAALQRARKTHCGHCGRNDRWFIREDPDKPSEVVGVECACDYADYIALKDLPK